MSNQTQSAKQLLFIMLLSMGLSFFLMSLLQNRMGQQSQQPQPRVWTPQEIEELARKSLNLKGITPANVEREIKRLSEQIQKDPQNEESAAHLLRIGALCQEVFRKPEEVRKVLVDANVVSEKDFGNSDTLPSRYPAIAVYNRLINQYHQSAFVPTAVLYQYRAVPPEERELGTKPFKELEGYSHRYVNQRDNPTERPQVPVFFLERGQFEVKEFREVLANDYLGPEYRKGWRYRMMDALVRLVSHIPGTADKTSPFSAHGLAIILFALLIRLVLSPLTAMQFRSMREMQKKMAAFQPEMKKLQEKYKGKKEQQMQMYQEMRTLQKKHGVNPFGNVGCLLMLVQMPILITLYYVIQHYQFQFQDAHFLWIRSLAQPDLILLGLYVVSMYLQSKLMSTVTPTADPDQLRMQNMMNLMMPVMFAFFLKGFPAALILYWFMFNVMYAGQQFLVTREGRVGKETSFKDILKILNPLATPSLDGNSAPAPDDAVPPRPEKERPVTVSARKARRKRRRK